MNKILKIILCVTFFCIQFDLDGMVESSDKLTSVCFSEFSSEEFEDESSSVLPDFKIESFEGLKSFYLLPKANLADFVKLITAKCIKAEQARLSKDDFWEKSGQSESVFDGYFYYLEKDQVGSENVNYIIIGDLHGNFDDLEKILNNLIKRKILKENFELVSDYKIICLGDYVDRGPKSLETVLTLMILRLINPDAVVLLRGNHENFWTFFNYGFFDELQQKLVSTDSFKNFEDDFPKFFHEYFTLLPTAYFLKWYDSFFQFNHGGWSSFDVSRLLQNKQFFIVTPFESEIFKWSDVVFDEKVYSEFNTKRGKGFIYSTSKVFSKMKKSNIVVKFGGHIHDLLGIRDSEQGIKPGYCSFFDFNDIADRVILTLISASIYSCFWSDYIDYNYFPTYLELNINGAKNKQFKILGYSIDNDFQHYAYLIKDY